MPVVVIASPKGGAGKSTTSVLLGTELALAGANVQLLDCDPNGSLSLWASRAPLPNRVSLVTDVTESSVVKTIKALDQDGQIVIVDLEGVASRLVSRAISQADLVITPMRATVLDATIGARAIELIGEEEEALSRKIRHAVVFTATKHVRSLQHRGIEASFLEQGVDVIKPDLMERSAYSALFEFGGDLTTLPPQGNMEAARNNAAQFAQEVYKRLIEG